MILLKNCSFGVKQQSLNHWLGNWNCGIMYAVVINEKFASFIFVID
jgi:hypothetical protein